MIYLIITEHIYIRPANAATSRASFRWKLFKLCDAIYICPVVNNVVQIKL